MKKYSRKNKLSIKKIICTIIVILGGIVGLLLLFGNKPTYSHTELNYKKVFVSYGETLWSIASRETKNNSYYIGKDVRYVINDIKKINNLETSSLYNNQELSIPQM